MNITPWHRRIAQMCANLYPIESRRPRVYVLTAMLADGFVVTQERECASLCDALRQARELTYGPHGIASARPLIERTEAEGYCRWPHALHRDALADAWRGWMDAQLTNEMEAV